VAGGEAEDARRITLFDPAATYASPYSGLRSTPIYAYADLAPLADGRVLVLDSSGRKAPRLLDPATGGTIAAGTLAQRASYLAVVAVPDGSALAFGGNLYADNSNASTVLDLVQRFDGTTWSLAGRLLATRGKPTVLRLDDGRCLVLGGNISAGAPWGECFDPGSGTSKALPAPPQAFDSWFGAGMVAGGRVLVAGSGRAFLFDPATFTWSATAIAIDATAPSFVLGLSGGGALLLKDVKSQTLDLASGLCAAYPSALDYIALALPLKDGRILVKGWLQVDSSTSLDALAVLDPAKGTSRLLPAAHAVVKAMVQLADGRIFLVHDGSGSSEFLDPARM
jgi:hypothetical protein